MKGATGQSTESSQLVVCRRSSMFSRYVHVCMCVCMHACAVCIHVLFYAYAALVWILHKKYAIKSVDFSYPFQILSQQQSRFCIKHATKTLIFSIHSRYCRIKQSRFCVKHAIKALIFAIHSRYCRDRVSVSVRSLLCLCVYRGGSL